MSEFVAISLGEITEHEALLACHDQRRPVSSFDGGSVFEWTRMHQYVFRFFL